MEVEIESVFVSSSINFKQFPFNSEQFQQISLNTLNDLTYLVNQTSIESLSQSDIEVHFISSIINIEKCDTIKILSKLILEIFVQCNSISLLKSIQFPSVNYILSPFTALQTISNLFELDFMDNNDESIYFDGNFGSGFVDTNSNLHHHHHQYHNLNQQNQLSTTLLNFNNLNNNSNNNSNRKSRIVFENNENVECKSSRKNKEVVDIVVVVNSNNSNNGDNNNNNDNSKEDDEDDDEM